MGHCLVGVRLICGLVMCTGWPSYFCPVSELSGALERLLRGWWVRLYQFYYVMFCFAMAFDRCLIKDYLLTYLNDLEPP